MHNKYNKSKEKLKYIMSEWLPAGDTLSKMIIEKLPSPKEAQKYRTEILYTGDQTDKYATAIKECDSEGPLMLYISKMVPTSEAGKFYAFGRVFSGKVKSGQEIYILKPGYFPPKRDEEGKVIGEYEDDDGNIRQWNKPAAQRIQKLVLMMGRMVETLHSCVCGNMVGIAGVDRYITKTATLSDSLDCFGFKMMSFSVAAVVQRAVTVKNGGDLPKLLEGLKRLSKSDPLVKCFSDQATGEHIIAGAGELHLDICLKDLQEEYCKGISISVSQPIVSYNETITKPTFEPDIIISKSPNKHNRLYMSAEPMHEDLVEELDSQNITFEMDVKQRTKLFVSRYGFDQSSARKIWCFGNPEKGTANMIIDSTKSIQSLNEIKDSVISSFYTHCAKGAYTHEPLRGAQYYLHDATLHSDSIHRGAGQISPLCQRLFIGVQVNSEPRLLEPVYSVEIVVPYSYSQAAVQVLRGNRGMHMGTEGVGSTPQVKILGQLPVANSFGFTQKLRSATGGQAFPQMKIDCWKLVDGRLNPRNSEKTNAVEIALKIRKRKGMKEELPKLEDYHDPV